MAKRGRIANFIEPTECLPVEEIPEGEPWTYELKLDGYRLVAVKAAGKVTLYSRRGTDLSRRFRNVAAALAALPDETVIDGELRTSSTLSRSSRVTGNTETIPKCL